MQKRLITAQPHGVLPVTSHTLSEVRVRDSDTPSRPPHCDEMTQLIEAGEFPGSQQSLSGARHSQLGVFESIH